jgi:hypothetical protein
MLSWRGVEEGEEEEERAEWPNGCWEEGEEGIKFD